jgi:hypothetical protein
MSGVEDKVYIVEGALKICTSHTSSVILLWAKQVHLYIKTMEEDGYTVRLFLPGQFDADR